MTSRSRQELAGLKIKKVVHQSYQLWEVVGGGRLQLAFLFIYLFIYLFID